MTTAADFQQKVEKTVTNFGRIDAIVNGGPDVEVPVDGATVPSFANLQARNQLVIGEAQDARDQAYAARDEVQSVKVAIVPNSRAVSAGSSNGRTLLTATFSWPGFNNGDTLDVLVPNDVSGPVSLRTTQTGAGYIAIRDANDGELGSGAFPSGSIVRLRLNQPGVIWNVVSVTAALSYVQGIANDASGARNTLEAIYKLPLGLPIAGNPNNIGFTSFPAPADQTSFEVIITKTNTGQSFVFANGPYLRIARGGGADVAAGELQAGTIVTLMRSDAGGGIAILTGSRPLKAKGPPVGSQNFDVLQRPWGAVSFDASGNRTVAAIAKKIIVPGSSNSLVGYIQGGTTADQPGNMMADEFNAASAGDGVVWSADNVGVPGSAMASAAGQSAQSAAWTNGTAVYSLPIFYTNDGRPGFYHANGGIIAGQINAMRGYIQQCHDRGIQPLLGTGPEPNPRLNFDAQWFAANTGTDMVYPAYKQAPVDPENHMEPRASQQMWLGDGTGAGVLRTYYKRYQHVMQLIRELAAEMDCILLDAHWRWMRFVIEPNPDKSTAVDAYYRTGEAEHYTKLMYDTCYRPVYRQFARAVHDGRNDIRVFRG